MGARKGDGTRGGPGSGGAGAAAPETHITHDTHAGDETRTQRGPPGGGRGDGPQAARAHAGVRDAGRSPPPEEGPAPARPLPFASEFRADPGPAWAEGTGGSGKPSRALRSRWPFFQASPLGFCQLTARQGTQVPKQSSVTLPVFCDDGKLRLQVSLFCPFPSLNSGLVS